MPIFQGTTRQKFRRAHSPAAFALQFQNPQRIFPQPTTTPLLSADKISPALPDFSTSTISAFQIFNRCGFGCAGKKVNAPGQGVNARSRFQISNADSFQSIFRPLF
jgi:hypothetical protein